jgi:hypothetical protein
MGPSPSGLEPVGITLGNGPQIRPRAERATRTGEHRHLAPRIRLEVAEGISQILGGRAIHSVSHLGPVDRDHGR